MSSKDKPSSIIDEENTLRLEKISSSSKTLKKVMDLEKLLKHLEEDLNLTITCKTDTASILMEKGYFKFSGYRKIFLTSFSENKWSGIYEDNVTDKNIIDIMQLDIDLSKLFFEYISIVEMKLKARTAFYISETFGCDAHLKKEIFSTEKKWNNFMFNQYFNILDKDKRNNDPIVLHHISNYDSKLPIWVLFDKISFGDFINFLKILNYNVKEQTFTDIFCSTKTFYNLGEYGYIKAYTDYLTIIKFMRNRICHYDRIIDYKHIFSPKDNKYKNRFIETFQSNHNNSLYLSDIIKLMGCFLNKEDYNSFLQKYKELIHNVLKILPSPYNNRLLLELGFASIDIEKIG